MPSERAQRFANRSAASNSLIEERPFRPARRIPEKLSSTDEILEFEKAGTMQDEDEVNEDEETRRERSTRLMLEFQGEEIARSIREDDSEFDEEQRAWAQLALADRKMLKNLARADGDMTPTLWKRLVFAYDFRCAYCERVRRLVVEHMTPVSRGGRTDLVNIAPACNACNRGKSSRTVEEAFKRRAARILEQHAEIVAVLRE